MRDSLTISTKFRLQRKWHQLFVLFCFVFSAIQSFGQVTLTSPAGAPYQWYNYSTGAAVAISGATAQSYDTSMEGVYYAEYDDGTCSIKQSPVFIVSLPGSTNSDPVNLIAPTSASTYQWYSGTVGSGTPISGETSMTYSGVPDGNYYVEFDAGGGCTVQSIPTTVVSLCSAGAVAPSLSSTAIFNTCPATTADLSSITATTPAGATLTWHTGTPATTANKLTPAQAAAQAAGTYYAAFYDATNDCYSGTAGDATTSVVVDIITCDTDGDGDPDDTDTDDTDPCVFTTNQVYGNATTAFLDGDCDGDGVTNADEIDPDGDGTPGGTGPNGELPTDINDPCSLNLTDVTLVATDVTDCDGDGVPNNDEINGTDGNPLTTADNTDPTDPCSLNIADVSLTVTAITDCDGDGTSTPTDTDDNDPCTPAQAAGYTAYDATNPTWAAADCDGDGVTNGDEDDPAGGGFTDPYSACAFNTGEITGTVTADPDCDGDGTPTSTDPDDSDPCTPAQAIGYTAYDATNAVWAAADCDGDGVTNGDEDNPTGGGFTDPYGACAFNAGEITGAVTADPDCDGDGVPESTDPDDSDPCTPAQAAGYTAYDATNAVWAAADCDGDGVTNGDEDDVAGGGFTDPYGACAFNTGEITGTVSSTGDCDGDGVTNADEINNGPGDPQTDPTDLCDYNIAEQGTPDAAWNAADCDSDGNENGTDPNPLVPTAVDDTGSASIGSTAIIDILGNDDFLPNDGNTITEVPGGTAMGAIVFDHVTGELDYTPTAVELGTDVTVIYEVCQGTVCDQATVTVSVIATPAAPDLFPNFTFSGQTFIPGQSKDVVININEISGIATTGQIEFFVPTSSGFTYTFDAVQTSATVLVPVAVNNGDWTMTTTVAGLLFTSNTVIPGNDRSRIALSATANIAGTKANLTANITPNSGGETELFNNTAVLSQSIQN